MPDFSTAANLRERVQREVRARHRALLAKKIQVTGGYGSGAGALNAWVRIAPNETVTLIIDKSEMGMGLATSLTMLLAEGLECDWKKIRR